MIPIIFNSDQISADFNISNEDVRFMMDTVIKDITESFADEWRRRASEELEGTRDEYVRNINVVDEGVMQGAVILTGFLPNALEQGHPSWDMKNDILNGPNAKTGKDGTKYSTIPFRFATPSASGFSSEFSAKLPQPVYRKILQKEQNIPVQGGGVRSEGLKESEVPQQYKEPKQNKITYNKKSGYDYKSSIYQGATRIKDSSTGQNKIMSFRRVSENSDPDAFIHPGFDARNIAEEALQKL